MIQPAGRLIELSPAEMRGLEEASQELDGDGGVSHEDVMAHAWKTLGR